jgi:hypothetical protein
MFWEIGAVFGRISKKQYEKKIIRIYLKNEFYCYSQRVEVRTK